MTDRAHKVKIACLVTLPLLGTVFTIILSWNTYVFFKDLVLLGVFYSIAIFGIGIGYHRMLTHQGFQTSAFMKAIILICGAMAFEGSPIDWASTHIKHHAHSDEDDDPHSPLHGFWHAHMGWLFSLNSFADAEEYAPHLLKDPVIMFVNRWTLLWMGLSLLIPFAVGGWTGLLWGGVVRVFLNTHVTWAVNSICHTFGKRAFETTDESRNHWLIGLLAFGEGWHNNHHAFPENAFHGIRWWQIDFSGLLIGMMERMHLVWNVKRVTTQAMDAHHIRGMTMHENIEALKDDLGLRIVYARREMDEMILMLPPEKVAVVRYAHEQTMKRLAEIQLTMVRRRNLKRAALLRRQQEVDELLSVAKRKMQLMGTM